MLFPIEDLLDEQRCYELLRDALHPNGLCCPNGHELPSTQAPHTRDRAPLVEYRCQNCGRVFNVFTNTPLSGRRHPCSRLVLILRGFLQGTSTRHLALELGVHRRHLLDFRHSVQGLALERFSPLSAARRGGRSGRAIPKRRGKRPNSSRS